VKEWPTHDESESVNMIVATLLTLDMSFFLHWQKITISAKTSIKIDRTKKVCKLRPA